MFTKSSPVISQAREAAKELKPFVIPTDDGEMFDYVCAVKPNAPIEYFQIGEVNFEKRVFPSAASDLNRNEEYFPPQFLVRKMTQKQAQAIENRAKETYIRVSERRNPKFDPRDTKSQEIETFPRETICLGDIIILTEQKKFNPALLEKEQVSQVAQEEKQPPTQDMATSLLEQNAKRVKK